jgi:hypothetical protein
VCARRLEHVVGVELFDRPGVLRGVRRKRIECGERKVPAKIPTGEPITEKS